MTTPAASSTRAPSLSHRRYAGQRTLALLGTLAGLALFGCDQQESCEYRCTDVEDACPTGLSCDITLGYCVAEDYAGTCDAETHAVVVCADEPVEIDLPDGVASLSELEGLPASVELEGQTVKGRFSKKTVFAFGSPEETRHYWRVDTTSNCPTLSSGLRGPLCVGEEVDEIIQGAGGTGLLRFEMVTPSEEFVVDEQGRLTGTALEPGVRSLDIAVTDARGVRKVASLELNVSNECPDVDARLPNSCAGSDYEAVLPVLGQAPVEIADFTPIYKDGKGLDSTAAAKVSAELDAKVVLRDDKYLLEASPRSEATGSYVFGVKLKNALSIEQRDIPFGVKPCAAVKADVTVCEGADFDVDLAGSDGDVWTFYDRSDPLMDRVGFVGERRLRGRLAAGRYTVRAFVDNDLSSTRSIQALQLSVESGSAPTCLTTDAGSQDTSSAQTNATGSTAWTDSSGTESSASTLDASTELPPQIPQLWGCVGDYLSFFPGTGGGTDWAVQGALPVGIDINPDTGELAGIPTEVGAGSFVLLSQTPQQVATEYRYTISNSCIFAFKRLTENRGVRLFIGHATLAPDDQVEVPLNSAGETVDSFAFDPTGRKIAVATHGFDPEADGGAVVHRVYVAELRASSTPAPEVTSLVLPMFPEVAPVREMAWSAGGQLAVTLDRSEVSNGGALDSNLRVYSYSQVEGWRGTERAADTPRGLVWMGETPCVAAAFTDAEQLSAGSVCWFADGRIVSNQGVPAEHASKSRARASESSLVTATPIIGETIGSIDVHTLRLQEELVRKGTHAGAFASPKGNMIAVARTGQLEIARPADATNLGPSRGQYEPVAVVDSCTKVAAWSKSTGALACTGDADLDDVTFVIFDGETVDSVSHATAENHSNAGQRLFVDDLHYVYDATYGAVRVVSLGDTPTLRTVVVGESRQEPMALVALPKFEGNSRIAVQASGELVIVDVTHGEVQRRVSNMSPALPRVTSCADDFGPVGFENWCGGDLLYRSFQVGADANSFLFLTQVGNLALTNALHTVSLGAVSCGTHIDCSGEFAFARPLSPN